MVSRFVITSILAVTLGVFMGTTAGATISNSSTTQVSCCSYCNPNLGICPCPNGTATKKCSIQVEGLLKGLGSVTKTPTAFAATVLIQEGTMVFLNPAGNSGQAEGVPFTQLQVELSGAVPINANQVSKNGKALSDIVFHDPELIAAIEAALSAECTGGDQTACDIKKQIDQHSNWIQAVIITKLQVLGKQFTDPDTTTPTCDLNSDPLTIDPSCTLVDALGTKCDAPPAVVADPKSFVWQAFTYACTDACHNSINGGTTCPADLPLP